MLADRVPRILGEDDGVGVDIRSTFTDDAGVRDVLASCGLKSDMLERYRAQAEAVDIRR